MVFYYLLIILFAAINSVQSLKGDPYDMLSRIQTECEIEALQVGTALADRFNSLDEGTNKDVRMHNDYLTENLGFAKWLKEGFTPHKKHAHHLQAKGGWLDRPSLNISSHWALEDQWLYMMGDSTQRQVWLTFVAQFVNSTVENDAKDWTRKHCARQDSYRKAHPVGGNFVEEGWDGWCGLNEITCDFPGYGSEGRITYDWKHFAYEDYDEWLFGVYNETGKWSTDKNDRRPDILTLEMGLHTCYHAINGSSVNQTTIKRHEDDIPKLMKAIRNAVDRQLTSDGIPTMVIVSTAGRTGYPDVVHDRCTWRYNRILVHEAHKQGFFVLEREEIERRLVYKTEYSAHNPPMWYELHLPAPSAHIVGTSLLALISCLKKNVTSSFVHEESSSLSSSPRKIKN